MQLFYKMKTVLKVIVCQQQQKAAGEAAAGSHTHPSTSRASPAPMTSAETQGASIPEAAPAL